MIIHGIKRLHSQLLISQPVAEITSEANNLDSDVQCSHSKDSVNSASKSSSLVADVEDEGKELDSCISSSSHPNNSQD